MAEADNIKVVQNAYAAFGKGDTRTLLIYVDDDVLWKGVYGAGPHVPTSGEGRGKPAVEKFFGQVAQHVHSDKFEPKEFIATGDKVVALGNYNGKSSLGKGFESDFAMVFTVRNGKVIHFQEFCNSVAVDAAYLPG